jgi:Mg-chelatase subunit ChlD
MTTINTPDKSTPQAPSSTSSKTKAAKAKKKGRTTSKAKQILPPKTVHIYILLDRSGSMESMRHDVVGGLNEFLEQQKNAPGRARVTLVQFDSQDPQETRLNAVRIANVPAFTAKDFEPRGGTPLLDATGTLIERALGREASRKLSGRTQEEVVFVTVTDGEENQSRHHNLESVRSLIAGASEAGWNFVFLGAGIDAYGDAQRLGYSSGSTQAWEANGDGAKKAWGSVSRAMHQLRHDVNSNAFFDKAEYFRGLKEAEEK